MIQTNDGRRATFDQAAPQWDLSDRRVRLAASVAREITSRIQLSLDMSVLDFGTGTGLLGFSLADQVKTIYAMDNSHGMLQELERKIALYGKKNIIPILKNPLLESSPLPEPVDLIISSMTLHHIEDIDLLLDRFYSYLNHNGSLAIADLDSEDGTFHAQQEFPVHHGFERPMLEKLLQRHNFQEIAFSTPFTVEKEYEAERIKKFPVFLVTARKSSGSTNKHRI